MTETNHPAHLETATTRTERRSPTDPGQGMAVAALICAVLIPLVGLILAVVARGRSRAAGYRNTLATWALGVSIALLSLGLVSAIGIAARGA